jgi:hypothetical protein
MELFERFCRVLAEDANRAYSWSITPVVYLFGAKDDWGNYVKLTLAREKPRFWELVILVHVPRNLTTDQLHRWFIDKLRSEPVLPAIDPNWTQSQPQTTAG